MLHRLCEAGNTVVVIEHNLDLAALQRVSPIETVTCTCSSAWSCCAGVRSVAISGEPLGHQPGAQRRMAGSSITNSSPPMRAASVVRRAGLQRRGDRAQRTWSPVRVAVAVD